MSKAAEAEDSDNRTGVNDKVLLENIRMIVSALEYLKTETQKTDVQEIEMAVDSAVKICRATYSSLLDGNYSRRTKISH